MSVHRIRIHADRSGDPVAVDLTLPSGAPVGELLPTIVNLVDDRTPPDAPPRGWRLDRPSGGALLGSLSLMDNGIHDGELLVLVPEYAPPLGVLHVEPCREVAAAHAPRRVGRQSVLGTACVLSVVPVAMALAWNGIAAPTSTNLIVVAVGASAAAFSAIATRQPTGSVAAVALAGATGFLTVPSGPAAPNFLLAAAAACAVALLVLRLSGRPSTVLVGATVGSALVGLATVIPMPTAVAGTTLSVAALGVLALAPRIAVVTAKLSPGRWNERVDDRAADGHAILTGLIAGCGSGAAVGAVLVAIGPRTPTHGAVAFTAVVGLVLVLRSRVHVDTHRQVALVASGFICLAASFMELVTARPDHAGVVGAMAIAVALVAGRQPAIGDGLSRTVDRLEYVALAAVVPVALWVGGAYAVIGEVRLP